MGLRSSSSSSSFSLSVSLGGLDKLERTFLVTGAMLTEGVRFPVVGFFTDMRLRVLFGAPMMLFCILTNSKGRFVSLVIGFVWPFGNFTRTVLPILVLEVPVKINLKMSRQYIDNTKIPGFGTTDEFPCKSDITLFCMRSWAICFWTSRKNLCCSLTRLNLSISCLWAASVDSSNLVSSITSRIFRRSMPPFLSPNDSSSPGEKKKDINVSNTYSTIFYTILPGFLAGVTMTSFSIAVSAFLGFGSPFLTVSKLISPISLSFSFISKS